MELRDMHANNSDDEDLEQLRLAALQSIKKSTSKTTTDDLIKKSTFYNGNNAGNHFHTALHFNKKTRGFLNRNVRMNTVYNRIRNTNLISIPTVDHGKSDKENFTPKLTLPQDRYNKNEDDKEMQQNSKFSRYDNSDNSDSESDSGERDILSDEDELKLERSNSLEALMQELENEIQGDNKMKQQQEGSKKVKIKKVKSKVDDISQNLEIKENSETIIKNEDINDKKVDAGNISNKKLDPKFEESQPDGSEKLFQRQNFKQKRHMMRKFGRHNNQMDPRPKYQNNKMQHGTAPYFQNPPYLNEPYINQNMPYSTNYYNPVNPMPVPMPLSNNYVPMPTRPLSPLLINTERTSNIPMAPLSPRSAAFVLQNQKIIERRKKSPRRSYSRSPSPRYRSPTSPRRSLSPRYTNRRSNTPIRKFSKQSSLSPRGRMSPIKDKYNRQITPTKYMNKNQSPKRQSRETSPNEKKAPVKERLGNRSFSDLLHEDSKPQEQVSINPNLESNKPDEPNSNQSSVLEARKKKFENEIVQKEGIIRLKKTEMFCEKSPEDPKTEDEDMLLELDDDVIDTNVDYLFSDEESEDENEGRFKLKTNTSETDEIPRKRKRKSVCGRTRENEKIQKEYTSRDRKQHNYRQRSRERKNYNRNETNSKRELSDKSREKSNLKQRISSKNEKVNEKKPVTSPIENKKIEIKIRNPSKYENMDKEERATSKTVRKVEIASKKLSVKDDEDDDGPEPEIIIDNEDDAEDTPDKGGDLRAQISRKRAEKQKLPISENFKSRLLQNALEEVVYKQKSKKLKSKLDTTKANRKYLPVNDSYCIKIGLRKNLYATRCFMKNQFNNRTVHVVQCKPNIIFGPSDARLPIHLRLGRSSGVVEKSRKKDMDQVSNFAFLFLAFINNITYIFITIRCYHYLRCNASSNYLYISSLRLSTNVSLPNDLIN